MKISKKLIKSNFIEIVAVVLLVFSIPVGASPASEIEQQMDRVFSDPSFHRALWGVKVVSLDTGKVLYERNAHKLFIPASNMKIITAASALSVLGGDYVFETLVSRNGEVSGGILKGDLIIKGSGDPSLGARFTGSNRSNLLSGDPWKVFSSWAESLKELGIREIEGNIVGDDNLFEQVNFGDGWAWDDMAYGYAAGFGALQFNESTALIRIKPAKEIDGVARAELIPELESMSVDSELRTGPPECDPEIRISRQGRKFVLSGQIPEGAGIIYRSVALPDPTLYFLDMLKETLERNGITVNGKTLDIDDADGFPGEGPRAVFTHKSPPLRDIVSVMLEVSQNQFAETVFRMLDKSKEEKGDEIASETVAGMLDAMGVPSDAYEIVDGSGLSRNNLLSPDAIVRVLQFMYRGKEGRDFVEMMPESGVKGTIKNRMKGTRASEKVYAKTGTLSWVRALSGYLRTEKGEMLAFSMLVNNYNQPRRSAEYLQDQALEILVGY